MRRTLQTAQCPSNGTSIQKPNNNETYRCTYSSRHTHSKPRDCSFDFSFFDFVELAKCPSDNCKAYSEAHSGSLSWTKLVSNARIDKRSDD